MNENELLALTGNAVSSLIHLDSSVTEAVEIISRCEPQVSEATLRHLLESGNSWRERLLAFVLGSMRGIDSFYESLLAGLTEARAISIVPCCAVLAVAIRDCGCAHDSTFTNGLDRRQWDGEIGFGLDWLNYSIGIGRTPSQTIGPNYAQEFPKHLEFYTELNRFRMLNRGVS